MEIICMAIAFQSVTASARTTDDIARAIAKPSRSTQNLFSSRISRFLSRRFLWVGLANWGKLTEDGVSRVKRDLEREWTTPYLGRTCLLEWTIRPDAGEVKLFVLE